MYRSDVGHAMTYIYCMYLQGRVKPLHEAIVIIEYQIAAVFYWFLVAPTHPSPTPSPFTLSAVPQRN